jgi:hypothetical protein
MAGNRDCHPARARDTLRHSARRLIRDGKRGLKRVKSMQIAKQLALFLENRPGMLARVCDLLNEAKINIYAVSSSDTVDHIVLRLVVSDPVKAVRIFEEHGTLIVTNDVLLLEGSNKPGSLAQISRKLAQAKVNIEYAYLATPPNAQKGLLVLRVSNPKRALKVLNS